MKINLKLLALTSLTSILLLAAEANSQEPKRFIKKGSVVCGTKDLWETQMGYVSSGVNELIDGCVILDNNYQVAIIEGNAFSASKIIIIEHKLTVWTSYSFTYSK